MLFISAPNSCRFYSLVSSLPRCSGTGILHNALHHAVEGVFVRYSLSISSARLLKFSIENLRLCNAVVIQRYACSD
jgi:hypothetical protein